MFGGTSNRIKPQSTASTHYRNQVVHQIKIFADAAIYFQRTGTDFGLLQGMPNLEYSTGCATKETIEVDHHNGV